MPILDKAVCAKNLHAYYVAKYGEEETDVWYEQPAVNVWVFGRENRIVTLTCHVLTGEVTERVETLAVVGGLENEKGV